MRIQKNICLFLFLSSLGGMLAWLWRMPNLVGRHIPINGKTMCIFDHVVTVPVSTPTPRLTLHHFPAAIKSICFAFQDFSSSSRHHQFHPLSDEERHPWRHQSKEKTIFLAIFFPVATFLPEPGLVLRGERANNENYENVACGVSRRTVPAQRNFFGIHA